jgi:peroxiredoxin
MKKLLLGFLILTSGIVSAQSFEHLNVGQIAPDFSIQTIQGDEIRLSGLYENNPVVLVFLRGYPGYQCPICSRQVGSLITEAEAFNQLGAVVIMIYPGPSEQLQENASEFSEDFDFPDNFYFTLDPDYSVVNKYGLRWDAPKETAYPSAFIINKNGALYYSIISTKHGGRAKTGDLLEALGGLN